MLLLRDTRDVIDETFEKKKLNKFCFFPFSGVISTCVKSLVYVRDKKKIV